jgi:fatty acid-binding protein DegV
VVQHIQAPEQAQRLVEHGWEIFGVEPLWVSEIGPVIGAHVGPGLLGVGGCARSLVLADDG